MASVLDSVAGIVGKAFSGTFYDATLIVDVPGAASEEFDPPAPTQVSHSCKALVEAYSQRLKLEGLVEQTDRKIMILASTLDTTPKVGDRLTVGGVTFTIVGPVDTDPATAVWTCRGRM